ncbi:MAG: trypsin-like peptidase domain-containing protein [Rhizorhabdus sp.]
MAFRSISKGGAPYALARRSLLVPVAAMLLSAAATANAVTLSGNDPTSRPTMMSPGDTGRFVGVGRVECRDPRTPAMVHLATGWVLGSADTAVTAAHIFFGGPRSIKAVRVLDPTNCSFVLYDRNEQVREKIGIRYALSPWADVGSRNDSSYDVAILKLDRPARVDAVPVAKAFSGGERAPVYLVAFHLLVSGPQGVRITTGQLRDFPPGQLRHDANDLRISSARRLFSTSADSSPGSSGGMYYDGRLHAAIGLHLGAVCDQVRPRYDPRLCFNYGLRFTPAIVAMVDMAVRDQPAPTYFISADSGPARLAEAPLELPRR